LTPAMQCHAVNTDYVTLLLPCNQCCRGATEEPDVSHWGGAWPSWPPLRTATGLGQIRELLLSLATWHC